MSKKKRKPPNHHATRKPAEPAKVKDEWTLGYEAGKDDRAAEFEFMLGQLREYEAQGRQDPRSSNHGGQVSVARRTRGRELHTLPRGSRVPVAVLEHALEEFDRAQENVADCVADVRAAGVPWRLVGQLTGLSHDAARKRWG